MRTILPKLLVVAAVFTCGLAREAVAQTIPDVFNLELPGGPAQTNLVPRILGPGREVQVVCSSSMRPWRWHMAGMPSGQAEG